jgi:hypothetical protein
VRIAVLFFAEAYQCYHAASIAFALMKRADVTVDVFHNMPDVQHHYRRLAAAHHMGPLSSQELDRSWWTRCVQKMRIFGWQKSAVLRRNEAMLRGYDAVLTTEDGAEILFGDAPEAQRPARILVVHGAGDRDVPSMPRRRRFDLILFQGQKSLDKMLARGIAREGHAVAIGYPKFDSSRLFRDEAQALFPHHRPIVLYNPHKVPKLGSWRRFIEPMLRDFSAQQDMNLIVAPHVKMMLRRSERVRQAWRDRSTDQIWIDPGSDRSVDNSYTEAADIYVGDVSSQVYEFLARPRPCVFLNNSGVDWRDHPDFGFWQLGDVVDHPDQLMDAIRAAPSRHHLYIDKQKEFTARSLGDTSIGASDRAADAILSYLQHGKVVR